jgi:hypothetical protein
VYSAFVRECLPLVWGHAYQLEVCDRCSGGVSAYGCHMTGSEVVHSTPHRKFHVIPYGLCHVCVRHLTTGYIVMLEFMFRHLWWVKQSALLTDPTDSDTCFDWLSMGF